MSGLVDYFSQHQDYFFYALAGICLLVDLSILGLSGPLFFVAMGSLVTGAVISLGLITQFNIALVLFAAASIASAVLLLKPLKKLQEKKAGPETTSDMVGKILPASARITRTDGRVFYSGVDWLARLDNLSSEPIEVTSQVVVTSVDGTILMVRLA